MTKKIKIFVYLTGQLRVFSEDKNLFKFFWIIKIIKKLKKSRKFFLHQKSFKKFK